MSYKFAFLVKKCHILSTFFLFRAQSYKKISIFALEINLNNNKKVYLSAEKYQMRTFRCQDCKMQIAIFTYNVKLKI